MLLHSCPRSPPQRIWSSFEHRLFRAADSITWRSPGTATLLPERRAAIKIVRAARAATRGVFSVKHCRRVNRFAKADPTLNSLWTDARLAVIAAELTGLEKAEGREFEFPRPGAPDSLVKVRFINDGEAVSVSPSFYLWPQSSDRSERDGYGPFLSPRRRPRSVAY